MDSSSAISLRGVTKQFGNHTAVSDFSLDIPRGSIYGLLGPNGSGKTTTIRMIMGILLPDQGSIELFGGAPTFERRSRVGYLPEERGVYEKMKVVDQLQFLGEIRGVPRATVRERALYWLDRLSLTEWAGRKIEDLSKGMQQKVQFIGTVLHDPDFLILDEPFSGLDPINQDTLEAIVREQHAAGKTILFSTHLMDQAERLCESVCLISKSEKVLDGRLKDLKKAERSGVLAVEFEGDDSWLQGPGVNRVEEVAGAYHLSLDPTADTQALLKTAVGCGAVFRRFEIMEPRLHEIFVRHAGEPVDVPGGLK